MTRTSLFAALSLLFLAGCATAGLPVPDAAEVARLEADVAADGAASREVLRLASAYRRADRLEDARALLERSLAAHPGEYDLMLVLGTVREDLGDFDGARELYLAYVEAGNSARLRTQLQRRVKLLERRAMLAETHRLVAEEQSLAAREPEPGTVAIYPFLYTGPDPEFAPLGRAFAELLTTDLSRTERLRVLERARVQMLLDEMKLAEEGYVDPSSAARSGRMLGAAHVVQGRLDGGEELLQMRAAVTEVGDGRALGNVEEREAMQRLFDAERRLALGLFGALGIQLTPAEEARVGQSPTRSLRALLAFGEALAAEDRGDFRAAAAHYRRAARLDASFELARQRAEWAMDLDFAARMNTLTLAQMVLREQVVLSATSLDALPIPDPSGRDPAAEAFDQEGLTSPTLIRIILTRPN